MKAIYLFAIIAVTFGSYAQDINIAVPERTSESTTPDKNTIYSTASLQVQPDFPGGITTFLSYIDSKIDKTEIDAGLRARVYVSFIIEADGSLTNIKILRDPGYDLGKAVENALKQAKIKWSPGMIDGKSVRTLFNLPVTITNDKAKQENKIVEEKTITVTNNPYDRDLVKSPDAGEDNTIYSMAGIQVIPEYPGGKSAFNDFILSKIKKPEVPKDVKTLKVYMSFVVEKDGSLTDVKTVKDAGYDIGKEINKVIRKSPKWNPGIQNGKPIRVHYNLPVTIDFK